MTRWFFFIIHMCLNLVVLMSGAEAALKHKSCQTLLVREIKFPSELHAPFVFTESQDHYVFEQSGLGRAQEFLKKEDFHKHVFSFLRRWKKNNNQNSGELQKIKAEVWIRASHESPYKTSLAVVVKTDQGNFLVVPKEINPTNWKTETNVLTETQFPDFLGFFPRKIILNLKSTLRTFSKVDALEKKLKKLGVVAFNWGSLGSSKDKYSIEVEVAHSNESNFINDLSSKNSLRKIILSAQRATARSLPDYKKKLFEFEYENNSASN